MVNQLPESKTVRYRKVYIYIYIFLKKKRNLQLF